MIQIRFNQVCLQFGDKPLLTDISFAINKGDRVAILGRNGVGKSTLLKLMQGTIEPDSGNVEYASNLQIATMVQDMLPESDQKVYDFLFEVFQCEHEWEVYRIDQVISLLNLPADASINSLSGGQTRRLSLAQAILNEPDVLLLDEPTNHLDIESIVWLENFLLKQNTTLVLITHDREFMQKIATRIFEVDLTKIISFDGSYQEFLRHKEHMLNAEAKANELFDKKLAQEEVWIRQGIKARRTRNEGRVRALKKMREAYSQRQTRQKGISAGTQKVDYSSKLVIEADSITVGYDDRLIIKNFSTLLVRGDKIGIIGPNGCGKSTLINALLGELSLKSGKLKQGHQVNLAVFDQHRMQLNLNASAIDNVSEGALQIEVNGKSKHVISYLQDFLFTPEKARSAVKTFSGGERNRLLLAKILAKPANLLILDEPTNDLDMESLEFLEEYLSNYSGTLLIVSHDRAFLDNVVTSTIAYEGDAHWQEYVGGYQDYLRQRAPEKKEAKIEKQAITEKTVETKPKKLSYKDQRELDQLPQRIEELELKIKILNDELCAPDFYKQNADVVKGKQEMLVTYQEELDYCFQRWEELGE